MKLPILQLKRPDLEIIETSYTLNLQGKKTVVIKISWQDCFPKIKIHLNKDNSRNQQKGKKIIMCSMQQPMSTKMKVSVLAMS